jgi:hypothetical protein
MRRQDAGEYLGRCQQLIDGSGGTTMHKSIAVLIGTVALAACSPVPANAPTRPSAKPGCPIIGSSDWAAWVNAMPGPNARPTLIVTGKVTVPTGGYSFAWRDMRMMESYPLMIVADLQAIPPAGAATQAVVSHFVRGEWPVSTSVGVVTIGCGSQVLARISPVETAH